MKKIKVLFLCANNSVHSPMAEALLNRLDSAHFDVTSAGIDRGQMHPLTVDVMKEIGVDLERKAPKAIRDVLNRNFDLVITLCDRSRSQCPELPGAEVVHWRLDNPLLDDHSKQKRRFQALRDQIAHRIRLFALVQVRFPPVA